MALDQTILDLISDEIGFPHTDFADSTADFDEEVHLGDLESIYSSPDRGNFNPLRTALIVWRRRLWAYRDRSFDVTTEGTLLNRRQKVAYMERRIKELELLVDETLRGSNMVVVTDLAQESNTANSAEFSG